MNLSKNTKIIITLTIVLVVVASVVLYKARKIENVQVPVVQQDNIASEENKSSSPNDSITAQGDGDAVNQETLKSLSAPSPGKNKNSSDASSQAVTDSITSK